MPSNPSALLRLELMASGENSNTWGTKTNTNWSLMETAAHGRAAVALAGSNVTLSATNYASDQSRARVLALSGTLVANVEVIVPNLSHLYLVENACTGAFTVTVKTAAGSGIVCAQGETSEVYCNGTNVVQPIAGVSAGTGFARVSGASNQFGVGNGYTFSTIVDGATITADCTLSDRFIVTLGGNRTLALSSPLDGQRIEVWFKQDGTGGRQVTFPANVRIEGGYVLSGIAGAIDRFELTYNQAEDAWIGTRALNPSAATVSLALDDNETNVQLFLRAGSPVAATTVDLVINTGVRLTSLATSIAALDLSGFASGSIINIVNRGYILGRGGAGGQGGYAYEESTPDTGAVIPGDDGVAGGAAINGPGSGITVNIYNADGFIWGGGGGGGGGGAIAGNGAGVGGGGGGGAGAGDGGGPGRGRYSATTIRGTRGGTGTMATSSAAGSGGTGNFTGGGGGASGGNGGDWGTAGTAGASAGASTAIAEPGGAGAAGSAVNLNGGTVNFVSGSGSPNVKGAVA